MSIEKRQKYYFSKNSISKGNDVYNDDYCQVYFYNNLWFLVKTRPARLKQNLAGQRQSGLYWTFVLTLTWQVLFLTCQVCF
ncbi:MAG: hypothetical protein DRQ49_05275 [Gammaproteobacteria bacterium]|nr:MAG: hypothetical protein DRQ49_05275 [Gammaproteobacteria bacterium]RKZ74738.1 MAG: hypothetical protein DRQ57_09880 [Gammaproteobacteria bacterium]